PARGRRPQAPPLSSGSRPGRGRRSAASAVLQAPAARGRTPLSRRGRGREASAAHAPVARPRVTLDTLRRPRYRPPMAEGESGAPKTALDVACFPQNGVPFEVLTDILRGGLAKAEEAGVVVVGGHTVIDEEIKFGMAVTGLVHPDRILRNVGARPGDALVLTK